MVSVERCTHVPSEPKKAQEGALMMGPVPVRHQHKVISFQCLLLVPSNVGGDEASDVFDFCHAYIPEVRHGLLSNWRVRNEERITEIVRGWASY